MTRANSRVRPATYADVDALATLVAEADTPASAREAAPEVARERLAAVVDSERIVLVAVDDADTVEGMMCAGYDEAGSLDLTPVVHVTHLFVAPHARRRGIGRALLAATVLLAEERGIDHVLVNSVAGARESNRYLARLGFAPQVVHRMASTSALHRTLGMAESPSRMAVLRRARRLSALRADAPVRARRPGATGRPVHRGA